MTTPRRRYAEGTTVTVGSSRGEISAILENHGVAKQGWMTGPNGDQLMFEMDGHSFRFDIIKPTMVEIRQMYPNAYEPQKKLDAEWRRRWRANVLLLKAKLEFIESGDTTMDRELLPYMLTNDGKTVAELIATGGLPLLTTGKESPR